MAHKQFGGKEREKMKLKLVEILNAKIVLEKLSKESFSAKNAYIIQRNIKNINQETEFFEENKRTLLNKYNVEIGENGIRVPENQTEEFIKEFNDLLHTEIEINILQISLNDFAFSLSPESMSLVHWMFSFEE